MVDSRFSLTAVGGPAIPLGPKDFKHSLKSTWGVDLDLRCRLFGRTYLGLRLAYQPIGYDKNTIKEEFYARSQEPSSIQKIRGGTVTFGIAGLHLVQTFSFQDKLKLSLLVGGGYYFQWTESLKAEMVIAGYAYEPEYEMNAKNRTGVNGGLAFGVPFGSRFQFILEGRGHFLLTKKIQLWNPSSGTVDDLSGYIYFLTIMTGFTINL